MTIIGGEVLHDSNIVYSNNDINRMNKSNLRSSSCSTIQPFTNNNNNNNDSIPPVPIYRSSSCNNNESISNHPILSSLSTSTGTTRRKSPASSNSSNTTDNTNNTFFSSSASAAILSPRYRTKFHSTKSFNHTLFQQQQRYAGETDIFMSLS